MRQKFLIWVLRFALKHLGAAVDAETKARVEDYNRRKSEHETLGRQLAAEIETLESERAWLEAERNSKIDDGLLLAFENDELNERLVMMREEKNKKLSEIGSLGDASLLYS